MSVKRYFFGVRVGRQPGVYDTWAECSAQVTGFSGAVHKKFISRKEAKAYVSPAMSVFPKTTTPAKKTLPLVTNPSDIRTVPIALQQQQKAMTKHRVHCDGACSNNGKPQAAAALGVFFGTNDPRNLSERIDPKHYRQTNQVAELLAAIRTLETSNDDGTPLEIISDSIYVVKGMNEWRHNWKKNGKWNNSTSLANMELWHRLDALAHGRDVTFTWVKGHSTDQGNQAADRLATAALDNVG